MKGGSRNQKESKIRGGKEKRRKTETTLMQEVSEEEVEMSGQTGNLKNHQGGEINFAGEMSCQKKVNSWPA